MRLIFVHEAKLIQISHKYNLNSVENPFQYFFRKISPQIYSQILFRGICSTDQHIQSFVAPLMNPLARGYEELYATQRRSETLQESKKDEFFGLRDFYR